jgi:DNA polymerase I
MATVPEPRAPKPGDHLFLVDGSSYIFRAYHALPPLNRKSDGLQINAVLGFCNMLWKLMRDLDPQERPTHLAVIFDKSEQTFRNEFYPAYKAHRPDAPSDLIPQFAYIREAVRAFDLPCLEQAGYEADDLIATYARIAGKAGARTTIVSSDKDLMQLVGDSVLMYDTMKDRRIGRPEVIEKFGVPPEQVIEVQALIGDSIDNVPGVPGIGPKAASTLIAELGSLERILNEAPDALDAELKVRLGEIEANIAAIAGRPVKLGSGSEIAAVLAAKFGETNLGVDKKGQPTVDSATIERLANQGNAFCQAILRARNVSRVIGSALKKVAEQKEQAIISRKLVTLDDNVPIEVPIGNLAVHEPDYRSLLAFSKAMELNDLTRRIAGASGLDAAAIEPDARLRAPGGPPRAALSAQGPTAAAQSTTPAPRATTARSGEVPRAPVPVIGTRVLAEKRAQAARSAKIDRSSYETVQNLDALAAYIARGYATGTVAINVMTSSLDAMQAQLVGIALAVAPNEACYVPLTHRPGDSQALFAADLLPDQIPIRAALDALRPMLEDAGVLKVGSNLKFDWLVLALHGIECTPSDDVMLISYALDAGKADHGLDALAEQWLAHKTIEVDEVTGSGKARVALDRLPIERVAPYAAERADVTWRLWQALKPRLAAEHVTTVYETLERPLASVLARMERRGISIDRDVLSRLSGDFAQRAGALEAEIRELVGEDFNPGSTKQLGDVLFGKMGLPGGKKTKTGAWSTTASVLEELAEEGHLLPQKILDWREVSKLRSTYTDALPGFVNPQTHRVHTSYALAATPTGRLSSSDPNLQNIPIRTEEGRKIRRAFIATEGRKLISADYSQIELRLLAEIADIPALRAAFREGLDIHAMTASEMFAVPIAAMPPEVRRRAKAINFGIIYGISAFGLANQLGIPREEAANYIKRYFERFPGIRDYMEETKAFCRKHGYVVTLFGRKCHYPDIAAGNPSLRAFNERAAINARLQGSAADIIRRAMIRIEPALAAAKLSAQMLLQVHDELLFEVETHEVEPTLRLVTAVMADAPHPALNLSVPLRVDARAADNWDEAH